MIMRAVVADLKLKVVCCGLEAFEQLQAVDCEGQCKS